MKLVAQEMTQKDKIKQEMLVEDRVGTVAEARNAKTMRLDSACSMAWCTRLERTESEITQETMAYPAAVGDGTDANAGSSVIGSAESARYRYLSQFFGTFM